MEGLTRHERDQFKRSVWAPLETFARQHQEINCCDFMYMGMSGQIYLYKHYDTRRYLNLDERGNCYAYVVSSPHDQAYPSITAAEAIRHLEVTR